MRLIGQSQQLWSEDVPYYEEALRETWASLCQNGYQPDTDAPDVPEGIHVLPWLNQSLRTRLHNFHTANPEQQPPRLPTWIAANVPQTLDPKVKLLISSDRPPRLPEIYHWVETDVTGELAQTQMPDCADVTCQTLILRRLPPATPWPQLSADFGVSITTLSRFYQQHCLCHLRRFKYR